MKSVEGNVSVELNSSVEEQLQAITRHQQQAAKSLNAFSRRIGTQPEKARCNAIKRLISDRPPGWSMLEMPQQRQVTIFHMSFEETERRVDEKTRKLDHINNLMVNDDEKLSRFLDQHVVTPFKSQYWVAGFKNNNQSVALELCGCSKQDSKNILDQLEALLKYSIHRLGSEVTEESQAPSCGQQVFDLLQQIKKEGMFCSLIAIEGNHCGTRASDLFAEVKEQFKSAGLKAIVLVTTTDDNGRADLERIEHVERYWFNRLEESRTVTRSLESQTKLVANLNQIAINDPEKGQEIVRAVSALKPAAGWRMATGLIDKQTQITRMEYKLLNEVLDAIEPLEIKDNSDLQDFLNDNVVTPFKNQLAYIACGLLKKIMCCVLCGSTVDERKSLVSNLESTLRHPVHQFTPPTIDRTEPKQDDAVKLWLKELHERIRFTNLECVALAIDTDLLETQIKIPSLVARIESSFASVRRRAIVLIMSSADTALGGLAPGVARFDFDPERKSSIKDKISWHLLNEIKKHCAENNKECPDIDWSDAVKNLLNVMSKTQINDDAALDKDIEEACYKKVNEFFSQLMSYCARQGHSQITQDAVEQSLKTPVGKKIAKLAKRAEDFVLPGQPALTDFLRTHVIEYLREPEIYDAFGIGFPPSFLLYGAPGTGKTHALEQLAGFTNLAFFEMNPSTVGSCYVDKCEQNMAEMFKEAARKNGAIILIDEIDSMLPPRDGRAHYNVKRTNELLRHIEKAQANRILVIGTTNRLAGIDQAALRRGRIGEVFEVKGLTRDDVNELLKARLKVYEDEDMPLSFDDVCDAFGENCLLADVYAFCEGLRVYASKSRATAITQELLDQYLKSSQFDRLRSPGAATNSAAAAGGRSIGHRLMDGSKGVVFDEPTS